jgi:hypothetical protein
MIKQFFRWFLVGSYLPKAQARLQECGAILIVGDWAAQRGVELDEDGINVSNFDTMYKPFINERLPSNVGEPRARALSDQFSREVTVQGEQLFPSAGVMLFTLGTACTLANDTDDFGDGSGSLLMDEVTVAQERAGWRKINMKLSSDPGVTAA